MSIISALSETISLLSLHIIVLVIWKEDDIFPLITKNNVKQLPVRYFC